MANVKTDSIDYEEVIKRIVDIYNSCYDNEKKIFEKILKEVSKKGYSETLEKIWLMDFVEVPVSIDRFLNDPYYLGETNDNGNMVYPFWRKTLNEIFTEDKNYSEIIFSGATRIGKTSTAISAMAYMLYRLMIYRDPHSFFKKKSISKFTVAFANLTKDLAAGVGFREYNDTLKMSPWFNDHGKFTRSEQNFYYIPEGDKIEIIAASDSAHLLGKQLWCLTRDTQIVTSNGIYTLESLNGKTISLPQINTDNGDIVECDATVRLTKTTDTLIKITLEDGFSITGTPEHRLMLTDGTYKKMADITSDDCIKSLSCKYAVHAANVLSVEHVKLNSVEPVYDVINAGDYHNFFIYDDILNMYIVSHNCLLMDEVNFTRAGVKDINKSKVAMKKLYDTGNARITGTFKIKGQVYGKMFTCSSKNSDSDYLSDHIETQLNAGNSSMYLVDEPQWKVLPPSMFSDRTFYIAVGDRYKKGFVIDDNNSDEQHLAEYESEGYQVLEVPRDFLSNFKSDYDIALRDIAGISVVGSMGFITQESVTVNVSTERKNPFYFDIIVCGVSDNESIPRNFHMEDVPKDLRSKPCYVHIDFAEVSDHIGICGVVQDGTKVVENAADGRKVVMPFYRQLFQIAIESPRGDRMSFQKVLDFVIWLRRSGINVYKVTTDQFQSSYVREVLSQQGFEVDKVSVDASDEAYIALRNVLQDQRIELIPHTLQEDELVNLKRINGRIDHPPQTSDGSSADNYSRSGPPGNGYGKGIGKDCADALAGSLWSAIKDGQVSPMSTATVNKVLTSLNGGVSANRMPSVFGLNARFR